MINKMRYKHITGLRPDDVLIIILPRALAGSTKLLPRPPSRANADADAEKAGALGA